MSAAAPAPRVCIGDGCSKLISKTSKGRCRACHLKLLHDPETKARCAAALAAYHARPEVREANRARMANVTANLSAAEIERRREHGRKMVATRLNTPESQAKALEARSTPEVKARRARSITRTWLPWLPEHLVEAYREMTRKGTPAAVARAALEPEIPGTAAHTARVLANFNDVQRIRQERERAEAY